MAKRIRTRKARISAAAFLLAAAVLAAYFLLRPRAANFARLRDGRDYSVILITVDTLRADKIGCYGNPNVRTPTIDGLAARGVRFADCISQTPLTLPSHTTILTGTLPLHHGVRDNGGFVVPAELETLAEVFKARGYDTAAFVSAYVVDSKWGLNQGFDTYFDKFDLSRFERVSLGEVQRPANEVMDEALGWLERKKDSRFFAWIHIYDPHTPYEPPEPFRTEYGQNPYLGEIAFADSQLARLTDFIDRTGLRDRLFVVLAGDHGESLGEHKESTHGFFVYQGALQVPLIIATPFKPLQGAVAGGTVGLVDVMPTICEMAGLAVPAAVQGRSLVPDLFRPGAEAGRLAYSETYYPRFHYGWSELRSVQDGRYKLILAPVPELYDLRSDPREQKNLVYLEKKVYEDLSARAAALEAEAGRDALEVDLKKVDEETREKLAALGYIGSFTDASKLQGRKLADPKDKIGIFNELSRAREDGLAGDAERAIETIRAIIAEDPTIGDAHFGLGNVLYKARRFPEALEAFTRALDLKPDDSFAAINVANCYQAMGRYEEAEKFVLDYLARGFEDSQLYFLLGNIKIHGGQPGKAIPYLEKCLEVNPRSASAYNALGAVYLTLDGPGDLERADRAFASAAAINPTLTSLRYNTAQVREKQGRLEEAVDLYSREIQDTPRSYKALYNLSRVYRLMGREEDELRTLRRTIEAEPDFPLAYLHTARILLRRGGDYREAIALARKGIELRPAPAELPLGYFLLADLYNRIGDGARSEENARLGQAAAAAAGRR
ncbi:MAG TPA: sulfatase-like hydrolase/transferase [Candidatus Aminicenantes bacterium]|nr:sulfatase-like hydrolase/transferase [Candidatus Aminicenantes bacterium]HRY63785.1 sulfatase-like hydrolase/transferase [Candidatus Aminicenantes bacterium]HRZ70698.1 sulfatase-like hydrolase/transferase [Candidatus Aminicenantes bacterium]